MTDRRPSSFHVAWAAPMVTAFFTYSLWSVTRHHRFGSGAWDLGCHNHNIWLLGHLQGFTSTVLGDVNFMGDHFMPSLVLLAPLSWTHSSDILLYFQALIIGAAAWPLALLCQRRGLAPSVTFGIVVAYLFAIGTQSAANFDFHEVAPLPFLLLLAIWALEEGKRGLAYAMLVIAAGFKESAIVYVAGVGCWLWITRHGRRLEGASIALVGLAWFLIVVQILQPWLLAGGPRGMIHLERFSALGATAPDIAFEILRHPLRTAALLVTPLQKVRTLAIIFGGFSFLPLLAPDALLLALPIVLERFLAEKPEMWGLGYHYSLVLTALAAFAAATGASRLQAFVAKSGFRVAPGTFAAAACVTLALSTIAAAAVAFPVGVELVSLEKPYFASLEQTSINEQALALVPDGAPVVAQDHFLPHLAMRKHIWLPEESFLEPAEYVVLDPTQDAWPRDAAHVARLVDRLLIDPSFHPIFSREATVVFSRRGEPAVPVTGALLGALARAR